MPGLAGRLMNPIDLEDLRGVLCVLVRVVLSWDLLAVCTGIGHFDPKSIFLGEIVILPENKSDFMRERWLRFRWPFASNEVKFSPKAEGGLRLATAWTTEIIS